MATRANITSVEAIESFRAALIIYLTKAGPALDEITSEVVRTRIWLQSTQRVHWEGVFKRRARTLEEAKAAVFSARLSNMREVSSAEQLTMTKAKRALDETEEKLRVLRRWDRDFDNRVEPLTRKLEKMHSVLHDDLSEAVAYLSQVVSLLDSYAGIIAPTHGNNAAPPTTTTAPDDAPEANTSAPPKEDVS